MNDDHLSSHYFSPVVGCVTCEHDHTVRLKLLEMLKIPLSPIEITMYYRRHLRYLERVGAIKFDDTQDRWVRIETVEEYMKREKK